MELFKKILRASDLRKSRLHDEKGNLVDFVGLCYLPKVIVSGFLRVIFKRRPKVPWISYRAISEIEKLMRPDWKVVEFGSGSSTAWLAKRCGFLYSIENNEGWYRMISQELAKGKISNVRYELRSDSDYSDLSNVDDYSLDFALVDGWNRADCMRQVIKKIKKGGVIYLDNSDKYAKDSDGDIRVAENLLIQAVNERAGTLKYFVDFAPSQFFVNEGLLARL